MDKNDIWIKLLTAVVVSGTIVIIASKVFPVGQTGPEASLQEFTSHLDRRVPDLGRRELDRLLAGLDRDGAIILVDGELAGLKRRGTSWAARGTRIVLRNYTHSRRLVVLPAAARAVTARLRGQEPERAGPLVFSLAPGETRIVRGPI